MKRDFKEEYRRRLVRGQLLGITKTFARGHIPKNYKARQQALLEVKDKVIELVPRQKSQSAKAALADVIWEIDRLLVALEQYKEVKNAKS